MNHKIDNVTNLYDSAKKMYNYCVVGSDGSSADALLNSLKNGIENLKQNWKGIDAGIQINDVITVYNATVEVRNSLANLAAESSKVAVLYREIQNSSSSSLETLTAVTFTPVSPMAGYTDTADTIDINPQTLTGKSYIDGVASALDEFKNSVSTYYEEITNNWTAGPGREEALGAFQTFAASVNKYQEILNTVSSNITQALRNYGLL